MLKSDHTMRVVQGRLASTPGGPIRFQRPARTRQPAKSERTAGLLRLGKGPCGGLALQLLFLRTSESMGNHDSNVVGAGRVG